MSSETEDGDEAQTRFHFPEVPGVSFRMIPGTDCAIASDRTVWNGSGGKWRKMRTYPGHALGEVVFFPVRSAPGRAGGGKCARTIAELMRVWS